MTLAYFDCFSGISGDMTLGALVDLGVPPEWLKGEIQRLPLSGFDLSTRTVARNGIEANQVTVSFEETHHHRDYTHIKALLAKSPFSEGVKTRSQAIFECIASAEAKIHGCDLSSVHFHEVGGIDAIVDIVGTCLGLERMGIDAIVASPLPLGGGFVRCEHGVLPVPAPATLEILKGVPVYGGNQKSELVTPTGAAIIAVTAEAFEPLPAMRVQRIGYGAGMRELDDRPNLLRIVLGEPETQAQIGSTEKLVMIETSIDDMNPEIFGYLMDTLFDDGALDVSWVPIHMKKNRPGTLLQVLCREEVRAALLALIFAETTTLGVRFYEVYRTALDRRAIEVQTVFGTVGAKQVTELDGSLRIVPEYEACKRIAAKKGVALKRVYDAVVLAADIHSPTTDQPSD